MTAISLRLPDFLYEATKTLAKQEHISINQFIATALAEKLSAIMTENYIQARAKRGSRQAFERAMLKVSKRADPKVID